MLGPFATASRRTPPVLHFHSPGVATVARRLRIDVHNNIDNSDNAWQRGPLWPWNGSNYRITYRIVSYCNCIDAFSTPRLTNPSTAFPRDDVAISCADKSARTKRFRQQLPCSLLASQSYPTNSVDTTPASRHLTKLVRGDSKRILADFGQIIARSANMGLAFLSDEGGCYLKSGGLHPPMGVCITYCLAKRPSTPPLCRIVQS